jgi:hypothetical protein
MADRPSGRLIAVPFRTKGHTMRRILALVCIAAFFVLPLVAVVGCEEKKKTTFTRTEKVEESEPYFESPGEEVLE